MRNWREIAGVTIDDDSGGVELPGGYVWKAHRHKGNWNSPGFS
jgi:hypothetical protein